MNEKMKKAEYLFSELSGIDERILAEALVVRKKQRWNAKKALVAIVAASSGGIVGSACRCKSCSG